MASVNAYGCYRVATATCENVELVLRSDGGVLYRVEDGDYKMGGRGVSLEDFQRAAERADWSFDMAPSTVWINTVGRN
jgi:hypothetical protein